VSIGSCARNKIYKRAISSAITYMNVIVVIVISNDWEDMKMRIIIHRLL